MFNALAWPSVLVIVSGALSGALAAARVDYEAFQNQFDEWSDFTHYKWSVASFRWFKGAVVGALSSAGVYSLFGG